MRTIPFRDVLHRTARLLGLNPSRDLNADRAATLTEYLNVAIKPAWQFAWWPEAMVVEARRFTEDYVTGEFIETGFWRYHPGSQTYYQALQLQPAATEAPATYSSGVWTENSAYWALLKTSYNAAFQVSGESLSVGDQRMDVTTRKSYQIHTAHVAASTTVDTTRAGELTAFRRAIPFDQEGQTRIGTTKQVCERDPRSFPDRAGKLNHTVGSGGIIVTSRNVPATVWVEFRERYPQFTSTVWAQPASGDGYDQGDLVYYDGGVFRSLIGDNEVALDATEQWEYVGFPEILAQHCALEAAANCQTDQKQNNRAADLRQQAEEELERVRDQEITAQADAEMAEVASYGSYR